MLPLNTTSQPITAAVQARVVLKDSVASRDSRGLFFTWSTNCWGAM